MSEERTVEEQYENRMKFPTETNLENFCDLEDQFLELEGRSYCNLGCSYVGYGHIQLDRDMPQDQAQGVFKLEIERGDDDEEWEVSDTGDWRYTNEEDVRELRRSAETTGILKELNSAIKKLNKSGVKLTTQHLWFKHSPLGQVKIKDGLSVQEVIGILKFEKDLLDCC